MWSLAERGWRTAICWLPVLVGSQSYRTKSFLVCVLKPCWLLHVVPWPTLKHALFLLTPQVKVKVKVSLSYSELLAPRHGVATSDAFTFRWSHNWSIRKVWLRWFHRILLFTFCNHEMAALYHVRVCRTVNKLGHSWCFITLERLSVPLCPWMGVRKFLLPLANYDAMVNASGRKGDISLQNCWQSVLFIIPWMTNMNLNYISRLISPYRRKHISSQL
jgi:hypothetical protein